jgi:hypothetical protein
MVPIVTAGPSVGGDVEVAPGTSWLDPVVGALAIVTSLLVAALRATDSPSHTGQSTFFVLVSKHAGNLSGARPA